ncbi:ATP synthase subunit I [Pontibacillus salicampi]|uniref:ATP synthase subunit I n=1 Tax=Pontibacillus salicampi TaxID=1449801 RepID=A0ABV6LS52_9BACI
MPDSQQQFQLMTTRQRQWMLYLLAILFLGWAILPYETVTLGLILGATFSFFNLWLMQRSINLLGRAAAENRGAKTFGSFSRLAAGGLAILIALQFNNYFHLIAVIIGLMTTYVVIMIEFIFSTLETSLRKRGE